MKEQLADKKISERDELIAFLDKEDLFEKRKYSSLPEGVSGFLIALFIFAFCSLVVFWYGGFDTIDAKLFSFCSAPSVVMGAIQYRYVIGSTIWAGIILLFALISWFIHYGIKYVFI